MPAGLCLAQSQGDSGGADPSPPPDATKPQEVKKLDGTKLFGLVEITDDYTIRVKSDSGIIKVPMALLGEKDFKKYGFQTDRSKDGRFWYERKEALESADQNEAPGQPSPQGESQKEEKGSDSGTLMELRLGELAPFQPLIAAYEKSLGEKKKEPAEGDAPGEANGAPSASGSPLPRLFSQPGIGTPSVPFTGGLGDTLIQPAVSAGSTLLNSAPSVGGVPAVTNP